MAVLKTPAAVLKIAETEVGYFEKKSNASLYDKTANAGSNNYTKYANDFDTKYQSFYNGKKNGFAWCDVFVDWCFVTAFGETAARTMLYQPTKSAGAGCPYSANYYRTNGAFYSTPKVGDQIFFGTNGKETHTGLVYKVDASRVYTIEGNTSSASGVVANGGAVAKKSYALNYKSIVGYGRPKYDVTGTAALNETGGYEMKDFKNSSGKTLPVYADTKKAMKVGEVYAGTTCYALDQQGNMVCIRYKVNSTGAYKVGWVDYSKGVQV